MTTDTIEEQRRAVPVVRRLRGRRLVALVLALVLSAGLAVALLVGGSSDSDGEHSGPTTVSDGTVAQMPEPAKESTSQGATYFGAYWLDLVNYTRRSLDPAPIRDLALPTCRTCAELATQMDTDRTDGTQYDGGVIKFLSGEPVEVKDGVSAVVNVTFSETDMTVRDRSGAALDVIPGHATMFQLELIWTEGGWRVASAKLGS